MNYIPGHDPVDPATRAAIVLLRMRVDYATTEPPTLADCWLLNAALHLEGRTPAHPVTDADPQWRWFTWDVR